MRGEQRRLRSLFAARLDGMPLLGRWLEAGSKPWQARKARSQTRQAHCGCGEPRPRRKKQAQCGKTVRWVR